MIKTIAIFFAIAASAFALNPYEAEINQVNSAGTGYLLTPVTGIAFNVVGFNSSKILSSWTPAQVIANAGLTTLSGYGIADAYTKTQSDTNYAPASGPFPWSGVTGAPSFLTSNQTITLSGDATGSGTAAITISVAKFNGQLPSYYLNYANLIGTPALAVVATTGSYADLSGKPSLATVATSGFYSDLSGTPTLGTASAQNVAAFLQSSNNLSDLGSATTARTNLGLGTASTQASSAFDASGAASTVQAASLQKSSNLSDVSSASTTRTNLGLGTLATSTTSGSSIVAGNGSGGLSNVTLAGPIALSGGTLTCSASVLQRARVTTDSSGNYTWTFPTAFGAGVVPIITVTCETSSGTQLFNAQYATPSNTAVIIHTGYTAILGLTFGAACTVSVTAQSP